MTERIQVQTEHLRKMSRSVKGLSALLTNIDSELSHRISVLPLVGHTRIEVDALWGVEHKRIQYMREHASRLTNLLDKTARDFDEADGKAANHLNLAARPNINRKKLDAEARAAETDELEQELLKIWGTTLTQKELSKLIKLPSWAFSTVQQYDERITHVSKELDVPKEMIQAVIYREQSTIGADDIVSDTLVAVDVWNDSTTGVGQVCAKTAIDAENVVFRKNLDAQDFGTLESMWKQLRDPNTNIYYAGLVLRMEAERKHINLATASSEQIQTVFSKYNGSGDLAKRYGEITIQYYNMFKNYNIRRGSF